MKNEIIISMLMVTLLSLTFVRADDVDMEIIVNGSAELDIHIESEDTEVREDVYGTEGSSPAEDIILQYIEGKIPEETSEPSVQSESTQDLDEIGDFCFDPAFSGCFNTLSSTPPQAFIEHLKAFGYDDESHINLIWTMCLQEHVAQSEEQWATDRDFDYSSLVHTIRNAVDWLIGLRPTATEDQKQIGTDLDRYFASDKDVYYLLRRVNDLQLRVEALENTMEEINETAYCEGKLEVLEKYNLPAVKCGETTYRNHIESPITGESMILGITPANEEPTLNGNGLEETLPEDEFSEDVLLSSENGQEETVDENEVITMGMGQAPIRDFLMKSTVFVSSFTLTTIILRMGFPLYQGMMYKFSMKIKSKFLKNDRKSRKISKLLKNFCFIF